MPLFNGFQMRYRLRIFHNLHIALVGFSDEDRSQMSEIILNNDGFVTNPDDDNCTHVVSFSPMGRDRLG